MWKPRRWVGGRLKVLNTDGEDARLFWCGRKLVVTRYARRRWRGWWVPGIAITLRLGRWEWQWL